MYPVLMAADILMFNANEVPVGRDQVQHIEIARDIGQRFNHIYGEEYFTLPEASIEENVATLPGTDGRKMSKSYNNTIPLWLPAKELKKAILGIVTDSRAPGEAKDPDTSNIFAIYRAFASAKETDAMRRAFADGIAWGEAKQQLFERVDSELAPARDRYDALIARPQEIEDRLRAGAQKARARSSEFIERLRWAVGVRRLTDRGDAARAKMHVPAALPQLKSYRESDGKFYFKLATSDGTTLLQSRGFDSPKEAGRLASALVEASDVAGTFDALVADAVVQGAETSRAVRSAFAQLKADRRARE